MRAGSNEGSPHRKCCLQSGKDGGCTGKYLSVTASVTYFGMPQKRKDLHKIATLLMVEAGEDPTY